MKIYVGNLAATSTEEDIRAAFMPHGEIEKVHLAADKDSGQLKGFAYVIMPQEPQACAAIAALNSTQLGGNVLKVVEATPKPAATAAKS